MSDLFQENNHRHLHGDSTKMASYESVLIGEKVSLVHADPPYCILTRRRKKGDLRDPKKVKNENEAVTRFENIKVYREFLNQWMPLAVNSLLPNGTICIWTNFLGKEPIKALASSLGLNYWNEYQWAKLTKESDGNEKMARIYEVALIFVNGEIPELSLDDLPECWSVVSHYEEEGSATKWENHPNHKPIKVIEPLIRRFTKIGDRVLDPFAGSGSCPEACIKLNRSVSCIEILDKWAKITQERIRFSIENHSL
ncbi:MAG: site-specific DNA-methyltransferase [Planctomycetota bacterium]|nr:MAG: site-specific DNA-methyltransferase [Planctomycetota bacterium]